MRVYLKEITAVLIILLKIQKGASICPVGFYEDPSDRNSNCGNKIIC